MGDITQLLPPSLRLPPHLSAHKYFYVCTLTVAAWDTLVLTPRAWRLMKTKEWPLLKINFQILRYLMPVQVIVVGVAFFDTKFTLDMCNRFYLFEPIMTMVLVGLASASHVTRVHAIYDKSRFVLGLLGLLLLVQVIIMSITTGFYRVMPLLEGQGCIAGPRSTWVGIYWVAPTAFYTASFALAVNRSIKSLQIKSLSAWKLMLRDGLNLYAAIWIVNMVNMLFWFIVKPTDNADTIRTIVISMTTVITTTMTLRIILSVRGSLSQGGSYAGSTFGSSGSAQRQYPNGVVVRTPTGAASAIASPTRAGHHSVTTGDKSTSTNTNMGNVISIDADAMPTRGGPGALNGAEEKAAYGDAWIESSVDKISAIGDDRKDSGVYGANNPRLNNDITSRRDENGVKVTVDRESDYQNR